MRIRFYHIIPVLFLFPLLSCRRQTITAEELDKSALLLFGMDTKSLGSGERTYRAALFAETSFLAEGTYCSILIDHSATVSGGVWVSPCRVDNNGLPLKADGTEATGLSQADRNSMYGLRYGSPSLTYSGPGAELLLVATSPARVFTIDPGNTQLRFFEWSPSLELYISDPTIVHLRDTWLDVEYVYDSQARLTLLDRRDRLRVHIECTKQREAYVQRVTLKNCVRSARWYLLSGYSNSNYTTEDIVLFNYEDLMPQEPMHLIRTDGDTWDSSYVVLPSMDYSSSDFVDLIPLLEIEMGDDTDHPSTARVPISYAFEPMKNYTININVSKSNVVVALVSSEWDDNGTIVSSESEGPAYIGTFTINGWEGNIETNADNND